MGRHFQAACPGGRALAGAQEALGRSRRVLDMQSRLQIQMTKQQDLRAILVGWTLPALILATHFLHDGDRFVSGMPYGAANTVNGSLQ